MSQSQWLLELPAAAMTITFAGTACSKMASRMSCNMSQQPNDIEIMLVCHISMACLMTFVHAIYKPISDVSVVSCTFRDDSFIK
jgi:hypothetical protein